MSSPSLSGRSRPEGVCVCGGQRFGPSGSLASSVAAPEQGAASSPGSSNHSGNSTVPAPAGPSAAPPSAGRHVKLDTGDDGGMADAVAKLHRSHEEG